MEVRRSQKKEIKKSNKMVFKFIYLFIFCACLFLSSGLRGSARAYSRIHPG